MSGGPAPRFEHYRDRYESIALSREDGVLTIRLHTDGGPLVWSALAHDELGYCFTDVGADRDNKVVVITGTGGVWCEKVGQRGGHTVATSNDRDRTFYEGRRLLNNLLDIEVPVISAVNGPARVHPEIPVMSDIVIAADTAVFQDAPHFPAGLVPADGGHVVWPHLLGPNRGRYFLIMGQELSAAQALEWGAVNEVVPADQLTARATEVAQMIARQPFLTRRYTRVALTQRYKRLMHEGLSLGLSLCLHAVSERFTPEGTPRSG